MGECGSSRRASETKNVKVIVADHDLARDIDGIQNVWIEKVGCGTANVNFSG